MTEIHIDDIIGAVKINAKWRFFAGIIAEWIMDYQTYDPEYNPDESETSFRNNILLVDESNGEAFCDAMSPYEILKDEIDNVLDKYEGKKLPLITIDFDNRIFTSVFFDIALEDYIPPKWKGRYIKKLTELPEEIKEIWHIE